MKESIDWVLLGRYVAGECSEDEQKRIANMIKADPEVQNLIAYLEASNRGLEDPMEASDVDKLWTSLAKDAGINLESEPKKDKEPALSRVMSLVWRYAAVLFLAGGLTYFIADFDFSSWQIASEKVEEMKVVVVPRGERMSVDFPDGTKVILDSGSSLKYLPHFEKDKREVWLEGKAFFDVVLQKDRPFVVRANHGFVEVVGTEFVVDAWPKFHRVDVVVAEGRVALRPQNDRHADAAILDVGQMGTLTADDQLVTSGAVDVDRYLGWMTDAFAFRDRPLEEIVFHMNRQFDVEIALEDASVLQERLTIYVDNPSLGEVLEVICTLTPLSYDISETRVRLFRQ